MAIRTTLAMSSAVELISKQMKRSSPRTAIILVSEVEQPGAITLTLRRRCFPRTKRDQAVSFCWDEAPASLIESELWEKGVSI